MKGSGRRTHDLAALHAQRDRLADARYRATLRDMTAAEFVAEARGEARAVLGAVVDEMTEDEVFAAVEDLLLADLETRDPDNLTNDERRELGQYRQSRAMRQRSHPKD